MICVLLDFTDSVVGGNLFRRFLRTSETSSDLLVPDFYADLKGLVVVRPLFLEKFIDKRFFVLCLNHFLQDSFAIVKELFMFNIIQNKTMDELFCISKTTIQINCADDRLHPPVRSSPFPRSR